MSSMVTALRLEDRPAVQGMVLAIHCSYIQGKLMPPPPEEIVATAMKLLYAVDARLPPAYKGAVAGPQRIDTRGSRPERRRGRPPANELPMSATDAMYPVRENDR